MWVWALTGLGEKGERIPSVLTRGHEQASGLDSGGGLSSLSQWGGQAVSPPSLPRGGRAWMRGGGGMQGKGVQQPDDPVIVSQDQCCQH